MTFLGTGTSQGVPVIACGCSTCTSADARDKRLRSSVLIQEGDLNLVIDSGPDFRQQMLRCGLKRLDALLFTHSHKDHIAGMDDIRGFNFVQKAPIPIYTEEYTLEALKREFYYVFEDHKYPGVPEVDIHLIENRDFSIGGVKIIPIRVFHYRMPVLGFRIGDFTYITDANHIPGEEKEKIRGSRVIVLNALRRTSHISHFNLEEAIALAREFGAEQTYFTHISHQMGLHEEVSGELPPGVFLAYDGLELSL